MSQEREALMSPTSLGMPTPNREGEDLEFEKFTQGMTPEKVKSLASELVALYKKKRAMSDGATT